jgi:hypothetical protein
MEVSDQLHASTTLSWGKNMRLGGPKNWSAHSEEEKISCYCHKANDNSFTICEIIQ